MDVQHRNNCKYTRISGDSTASGETYIQIHQLNGDSPSDNNNVPNHVSSSDSDAAGMTCTSMDRYSGKEGVLQRYGSSNFSQNGSDGSLHRRKCRFIKKSGHCNVSHTHLRDKPQRFMADIFTTCVDLRWRWNLLLFSTAFVASWLFFGIIYWVIAYAHGDFAELEGEIPKPKCVNNLDPNSSFTSAFLFSLETQTTIGYGFRVVTEECPSAIIIVVVQSVFGCVIDAFMIGLIMAKISRPKKRAETLLFSKKAVINVRDGQMCLMVRVGNLRKSHLVEATIRMQYLYSRTTLEGEYIPLEQVDLHLDLKNDSDRLFLVTPQTICHPIDSESPLYHMSKETLMSSDFEIIVILEGMVEATGMTTQARASYLPGEILWGQRFENVISFSQTNGYHVNFKKFDSTYLTDDAPTCSAAELVQPERMITNGPIDSVKRRSITNSAKIIREDSCVSEGRDSGYTPVDEDEDSSNNSAKTLVEAHARAPRLSSASSGESSADAKRRSWVKDVRKDDEDKEQEAVTDTVFLTTVEERNFNRKKRKSVEIAAQNTRELNLKNSALSAPTGSPANILSESALVQSPATSEKDEALPLPANPENSVMHQPTPAASFTSPPPPVTSSSHPVTSPNTPKSEDKTLLAVEPVLKSSDETVCLLEELSPGKQPPAISILENVPNGIRHADSPV